MTAKKLISIRIDSETCAKLDHISRRVRHYSRSAVINAILDTLVDGLSQDEFRHFLRYWRQDQDTMPTIFIHPARKFRKD